MKNIGDSFTFPFKDPEWPTKIIIGGLFVILSFAFVGLPVLYGYFIELIQRVRRREQQPLPEWKDVGVKFITGIKYLVALLVYSIPVILVMAGFVVFMLLLSLGLHEHSIAGFFTGMAGVIFVIIFVMPYSLVVAILTPVITLKFAERERISDALRITEVFRTFRMCWQDTLIAALIGFGVEILASAGLLMLIIGVVLTIFYASLVRFHLIGQIAQSIDDLAQTRPV